jgi:hypothetical protein
MNTYGRHGSFKSNKIEYESDWHWSLIFSTLLAVCLLFLYWII